MKYLSLILFLSIPAVVLSGNWFKYDLNDAANLFDKFVKDYQKVYKDASDKKRHFEAFKKNLADINLQNFKKFPNAIIGISKFADLIAD